MVVAFGMCPAIGLPEMASKELGPEREKECQRYTTPGVVKPQCGACPDHAPAYVHGIFNA